MRGILRRINCSIGNGEVWLSHGNDLAGSLRTPAAYCGIVGFRLALESPGNGLTRFQHEVCRDLWHVMSLTVRCFLTQCPDLTQVLSILSGSGIPYQDAVKELMQMSELHIV